MFTMKNLPVFFFISAICAAVLLPQSDAAPDASRPNVVWIFVEDMNGWYGCYGDDTVPTPNINGLAKRGGSQHGLVAVWGVFSCHDHLPEYVLEIYHRKIGTRTPAPRSIPLPALSRRHQQPRIGLDSK